MSQLLELIGRTPLVDLQSLSARPEVRLFGKLEGQNPGGSVKDRPALFMIRGAIQRGELRPGLRLIEATSGNTGIALAMIARQLAYDIELVMPEDATRERVQTMRAFGATVTLTDRSRGMEGAIDYVRAKLPGGGCLALDQFANPDNVEAHYRTTGPEIWQDTGGLVTHFVSAMGTTGTIMGVAKFLKEQSPAVQVVGVQPAEGSAIPGIRKWPEAYLPKIFESRRLDRIIEVSTEQAAETARRLARQSGVFAGVSSGGAVYAAMQLTQQLQTGLVVCIICDRGDRYLSSDLFA